MSNRFVISIVFAFLCFTSLGAPISPQEALKRAEDLSSKFRLSIKSSQKNNKIIYEPSLIYTVKKASIPTIYLFETGDGILCLSADNTVPPILGYTDNCAKPEDFPPAFIAWMNTISREISYLSDRASEEEVLVDGSESEEKKDFDAIAPLCKTFWDQCYPYNKECPKANSPESCYTGCVATSMAQVMKYHNWPFVGVGSIAYYWEYGHLTLETDFSEQSFDWDNMLDYYMAGDSEEEVDAVAQLMKACGYSVEMNYSHSASGSYSPYIARALVTYFKYDKEPIRYVMRDYYTLADWQELIYKSLKDYGPVILDGQSNQGGHSFVCDGYDKDGYFHINWGWGGVSNGYYLLSVLDPYNQGIGGSGDDSGFNYMQDAIIGITPAHGTSPDETWHNQLYGFGVFGIDTSLEYSLGDEVGPFCEEGVFNFGPAPLPEGTLLGLLFREAKEDGEDSREYVSVEEFEEEIPVPYGFVVYGLPLPEEIPDGIYNVTLAYKAPSLNWGEWTDILFKEGTNSSYKATVKDGIIRFEESDWKPGEVEEIESTDQDSQKLYFNLQGMPIQNPAKGEIVIVKEGKKSYKRAF